MTQRPSNSTVERIAEALEGHTLDSLTFDSGMRLEMTLTAQQARRLAEIAAEAVDVVTGGRETAQPEASVTPAEVAPQVTGQLTYRPPIVDDVEFSTRVSRFILERGLDEDRLRNVVLNPDDTWQDHNPKAADKASVAVRDDSDYGVVYYPEGEKGIYVVSVRPVGDLYVRRRALTSGFRSNGGGGPKKSAVDSLTQLRHVISEAGLAFEQGQKHGKVFDPARPELGSYTVPITPSDVRSWQNTVSGISRQFGVSL